jgi:hypothetical protein
MHETLSKTAELPSRRVGNITLLGSTYLPFRQCLASRFGKGTLGLGRVSKLLGNQAGEVGRPHCFRLVTPYGVSETTGDLIGIPVMVVGDDASPEQQRKRSFGMAGADPHGSQVRLPKRHPGRIAYPVGQTDDQQYDKEFALGEVEAEEAVKYGARNGRKSSLGCRRKSRGRHGVMDARRLLNSAGSGSWPREVIGRRGRIIRLRLFAVGG